MTTIAWTGLLALAVAAPPSAGTESPLWPEGQVPHTIGKADRPTLTAYPAPSDGPKKPAVIVIPGGGYGHLALDHEGVQVAEFFNAHGVHAFVLKYRIATKERPGPLAPAPLEDAQRAVRTVRANAADYGVDPTRIGVIGFSAGGHLASTIGTHFDAGIADAADPIDRAGCRPDFLILGYPVISMEDGVTHGGSRRNLLGNDPTPEQIADYSNEKQVTPETPPTFIFQTNEDTAVPAENAVRFYLALRQAKVPAEMHIYEKGRHGVGINPKNVALGTDAWKERLAEWLNNRGILAVVK